jgi:3-keto-L-gulonate-6-phosphate decarboxylase
MTDIDQLEEGEKLVHEDGTERFVHRINEGFGDRLIILGVKTHDGTIIETGRGHDRLTASNASEWRLNSRDQ